MSSPREVTAWGPGSGPERGEWVRAQSGRRAASRALGQGLELGAARGDGQGGPQEPESFAWELEVPGTRGPRRGGRREPPGAAAQPRGDAEDPVSRPADACAVALAAQLSDQEPQGWHRNPSPEGCPIDVAAIWAGLEAGPSGRGPLFQSCVELLPAAGAPCHLSGPEGGRARGAPKRGPKGRWSVGGDGPWRPASPLLALPTDLECSEEISEIHMMRVSIYSKGGVPASAGSPDDPGDTGRPPSFPVREGFIHGPGSGSVSGSLLAPSARGLTMVAERQAAGEPDVAVSKRLQGTLWGKAGGRPGHPGAVGVAGLPLPRAVPRRKVAQVSQPLGPGSEMALGRTFPPWGQRIQAAPLEPASFPPISGIQLLGRAKKQCSVPSASKQSKGAGGSGKRSGTRKPRGLEPVAAGDENDPDSGPVPKGQGRSRGSSGGRQDASSWSQSTLPAPPPANPSSRHQPNTVVRQPISLDTRGIWHNQ
ncbi:putative protein CXorf49, partial [Galemys pyrenaicus]